MATSSIPVIDFSAFYSPDAAVRDALVQQIGKACRTSGFFSLVNHGIPDDLQAEVLACSEELFGLPLDVKESYSKDIGGFNRGYERLRAQNFEKRTEGDLKEGYYFGLDLPLEHPNVAAKKFGQGPNKYPQHVQNAKEFKQTIDTYFKLMRQLAESIIKVICRTLGLEEGWVSEFVEDPIAVLRLLHYPPQAPDASSLERGIGAHTDFGAVTILLQDDVGGLQVWDRVSNVWVDVEPIQGGLVVNLGNLMMRWTNDRYISNLHRVINKTGRERYSVPFFFSGNPDFLVKCFPQCEDEEVGAKYSPIRVEDWIGGRYADTYGPGVGKGKAMGELSVNELEAGIA